MSFNNITPSEVMHALRAVRSGESLRNSPLIEMDGLLLMLRDEGLPDTSQGRAWILEKHLTDLVLVELTRLRGAEGMLDAAEITPDQELMLLRQDFVAGNPDREMWGLLYSRYLGIALPQLKTIAPTLGVVSRTLTRRLERGYRILAGLLCAEELKASRELDIRPGVPARERVIVNDSAPERQVPAALSELVVAIRSDNQVVRLQPKQMAEIIRHPAADLTQFRSGRIAEWSRPRYRLDERFVNLSLLIDDGESLVGDRWGIREVLYTDLGDLLQHVPDPVLVLLGPPGSGKSTLLRRLELDIATDGLRSATEVLTFLVQLNRFPDSRPGEPLPSPHHWLSAQWADRYAGLPSLDALLEDGRMLLLFDGLNEMPHSNNTDYRRRLLEWKTFLEQLVTRSPGNRAVFSCRSLDYSAPLSTQDLRVPQIRIEPLTNEQVQHFLRLYCPASSEEVWDTISQSAQIDMLRTPYLLRLLVDHFESEGKIPAEQAGLFTGFVRHALEREIVRQNPLFKPGSLVTERDCRQVASSRKAATPYTLPERGELFQGLSKIAFAMQSAWTTGEMAHLRFDYEDACTRAECEEPEKLVRAAQGLNILDDDLAKDEVRFAHQLLQEYFAARHLTTHPDPKVVSSEWDVDIVDPAHRELIEKLAPTEPLPPLPSTGWEETMLMAVAMAPNPNTVIPELMQSNLSFAGRCASQRVLRDKLDEGLLGTLRWELATRSRNAQADLRDRIGSALALGDLGDPRFERRRGEYGEYLSPQLVEVAEGFYQIGEDEPYEYAGDVWTESMPKHKVFLRSFSIGKFPVTNAEWRHFMNSEGYGDPQWWDTESAKRWLQGVGKTASMKTQIREAMEKFLAHPTRLEEWRDSGQLATEIYDQWQRRLAMSEKQLEDHITTLYPDMQVTEPHFWRDSRFNHPSQPVVGLSWFEARAYCIWLSKQTGLAFRLPTEPEWEAACRGHERRIFAYGDRFDPLLANTVESHLHQLSPVGVFVGGDTPTGIADMTGNVWERTSSIGSEDFPYPYVSDDGRENPDTSPTVCRVARGGTWTANSVLAQASVRLTGRPDLRNYRSTGFRLVCIQE